jgi:protein-disulfide isomerase
MKKLLFIIIVTTIGFFYYSYNKKQIVPASMEVISSIRDVTENRAKSVGYVSKDEIEDIISNFIRKNPEVIISSLEYRRAQSIKDIQSKIQANTDKYRKEIESINQYTPIISNCSEISISSDYNSSEKKPAFESLSNSTEYNAKDIFTKVDDVKDVDIKSINTGQSGITKSLSSDGSKIITIAAFVDYTCSYCSILMRNLSSLIDSEKNIRVIILNYPSNQTSYSLSKIAVALHKVDPAKFKKSNNTLLDQVVNNTGKMTDELQNLSIDLEKLKEVSKSSDITSEINRSLELGKKIGINSTPLLMINGKAYIGLLKLEELKNIIAAIKSDDLG